METKEKTRESKNNAPFEIAVNKTVEEGHFMNDWFVFRDNRHFGPLTTKQIRTCLKEELITKNHHIWRHGFEDWKKIKEIDSFSSYGVEKSKMEVNDESFAKKAKIENLDSILLEDRDLNFDEKRTEDKSFSIASLEKYIKNHKRFIPGVFLALLAAVGLFFVFGDFDKGLAFKNLGTIEKNRLLATSQIPESAEHIAFETFKSFMVDPREPVLVTATNLPKGSKIKYIVSGVSGSLVGSYRYEREFEKIIDKKIFSTNPLRRNTGQFIPEGSYTVSVTCLSCGSEKSIFERNFEFITSDLENYKKDLKAFNLKTRRSAKLELDELYDMALTLKQQYHSTAKTFVKVKQNLKRKKLWSNFSRSWLEDQKKLISLFEQLKNSEFRDRLYYRSLYDQFADLTGQIFELHVLQDSILNGDPADSAKLQNTTQISQNINLTLEFLKSQVDLMNVNYNQSDLLPPKTGLIKEIYKEGV